jgi:phosphohistidine phosphatase
MRHGIAVAEEEPGVKTGGGRPLSGKGMKRMRRAARGLKYLDIPFDLVLTSPLPRARQTADIVAQTLGLQSQIEEISSLAPESSVDQLIDELGHFQDRKHLLLVGHQPLLSNTLSFLLTTKSKGDLRVDLRKGGICRVEVEQLPPTHPGQLHWLLLPKQLRLLGERTRKD